MAILDKLFDLLKVAGEDKKKLKKLKKAINSDPEMKKKWNKLEKMVAQQKADFEADKNNDKYLKTFHDDVLDMLSDD